MDITVPLKTGHVLRTQPTQSKRLAVPLKMARGVPVRNRVVQGWQSGLMRGPAKPVSLGKREFESRPLRLF